MVVASHRLCCDSALFAATLAASWPAGACKDCEPPALEASPALSATNVASQGSKAAVRASDSLHSEGSRMANWKHLGLKVKGLQGWAEGL